MSSKVQPLRIADAREGVRHVFVRDLMLDARIGVHRHEKKKQQRIRVNLDMAVREDSAAKRDNLDDVVCYEKIVVAVRALVGEGHVNLVETLAERVAALCLQDARVISARVRVEKLDVFEDAMSVGVEIERFRS
ncbi:MAG TPA: dihydroneopterin aldolase [Burkholderiales bacterium]|nr:dihydroneopterin aldolase [Burkholderiales bacterium]